MTDRKKVIILYSTGGMGHKKAAIAIFKAFESKQEDEDIDVEVEIIDVLEYASRFYEFLYLKFYVFMMTRAKWLWGAGYFLSNIPLVDFLTRGIRGKLDYSGLSGLGDMLVRESPDAIIATHFFLPSIAKILNKRKGFRSKMYTLITDYGPHSFWLSKYIDRFFTGSKSAALELAKRGIPREKIDITGIATTDEFRKDLDVDKLREVHGIDGSKKTIFLMSGGFGVGPIEEMLLSLNSCSADIQVITVCGHNKPAYDNIQLLKEKLDYPLVLLGFTGKVAELMAISDLMVTKAGGISVTEALNARLPMILFGSIPGQETWNEHFLLGSGAAKKAETVKDIPIMVDRILLSEDVYNSIRSGIDKVRRPYAAEKIVEIVLGEIE